MSERRAKVIRGEHQPINWRQTADGVTVYDEENKDAWIHVRFEAGVKPEDRLFMICTDCGGIFPQRSKPGNGSICGDCGTTYDHDNQR